MSVDSAPAAVPATQKRRGPRHSNGMGTVWEDPRGSGFIGQIRVTDRDGKRVRRTMRGATRLEVAMKLAALRAEEQKGTLAPPNYETVEQFLRRYLDRLQGSDSKLVVYRSTIERHILPAIGKLRLSTLQPQQIEDFYVTIKSQTQRNYVHVVLRSAFRRAVKLRRMPENPCDLVDAPKKPSVRAIPLRMDQVTQLLDSVRGGPWEAMIVTGVLTGMREGELFGLQRSDVDLDAGRISVLHALKEVHGRLTLSEPKSKDSCRVIDLPQIVVQVLREHFAKQDERRAVRPSSRGYVFLTPAGTRMRRSNWCASAWPKILKNADLPHFKFHALRHTMATLLLAAQIHPKVVQERLGHKKIGLTLDTYSHVIPSLQREAAERLDEMFRR